MDQTDITAPGDEPQKIVYIRPIDAEDLGPDVALPEGYEGELYSVNAANGRRLAVVGNQKMAFVLARQNDFAPVYVH
ncbi:MAG: DUF1150 family protein [Mangrovicoccus sp.]